MIKKAVFTRMIKAQNLLQTLKRVIVRIKVIITDMLLILQILKMNLIRPIRHTLMNCNQELEMKYRIIAIYLKVKKILKDLKDVKNQLFLI